MEPSGALAIAIVAILGGVAAGRVEGGLAAIVVSVLLVLVSKRALKLDERDRPLHQLAHRIVTRRGTRFTGADVSGEVAISRGETLNTKAASSDHTTPVPRAPSTCSAGSRSLCGCRKFSRRCPGFLRSQRCLVRRVGSSTSRAASLLPRRLVTTCTTLLRIFGVMALSFGCRGRPEFGL